MHSGDVSVELWMHLRRSLALKKLELRKLIYGLMQL